MRLTVHIFQTLDGVMQSPGHPQEDIHGGFTAGGWLPALADEDFGQIVDSWYQQTEALLFGRNTWEIMQSHWPQVTDPQDLVAAKLNTLPKHLVTSRPLDREWAGTTVLTPVQKEGTTAQPSVMDAVAELKAHPGGELQVHGCTRLVHALHRAQLIDEYRLITFPVTVGGGARTFPQDAPPAGMQVVDERRTSTGAFYTALQPAPFQQAGVAVIDGKDTVRAAT